MTHPFHQALLTEQYSPFGQSGPTMDGHQVHELVQQHIPPLPPSAHHARRAHQLAQLVAALLAQGGRR